MLTLCELVTQMGIAVSTKAGVCMTTGQLVGVECESTLNPCICGGNASMVVNMAKLKALADGGDVDAQWLIGRGYTYGMDWAGPVIPKDTKTARMYYEKVAASNTPLAVEARAYIQQRDAEEAAQRAQREKKLADDKLIEHYREALQNPDASEMKRNG